MSEPNVKGRWESFLPDEIVINILSRLHPKDVLRCRCVAKKWSDLTSTPFFVDLHKRHGVAHMLLVDVPKGKGDRRNQYFLDEWWITARKRPPIQKFHSQPLYWSNFSQDGLLVMASTCKCSEKIVIVNPIFHEKVEIVISRDWHFWAHVYGVYFNPTLQEYCALFQVAVNTCIVGKPVLLGPKPPVAYKMLTLGPKPCLIDIRNPYKDRPPSLELRYKQPAMVDGFLYWLIDGVGEYPSSYYGDIMEFNTTNDQFKLMPCPAPLIDYGPFGQDLLNIDGFLSLVQIVANQGVVEVNMWTLKDRASESWTFSQYDLDYKVYPPERGWMHFETIAVRCGEILIRSEQKLYVCHLEWGTAKVLGSKTYNEFSTFFPHDICLSSLKNCKRMIRIVNIKKCRDCEKLDKKKNSVSNSAFNEHSDVVEEIAVCALDEGAGSSTYVDGEMTIEA